MKKYQVPQVEEVEVKALFDINDMSPGDPNAAPARQNINKQLTV